jgi:hypothetical protein
MSPFLTTGSELLMMKRRGAPQPYFVAWLGNADLLRGK